MIYPEHVIKNGCLAYFFKFPEAGVNYVSGRKQEVSRSDRNPKMDTTHKQTFHDQPTNQPINQ